MKAGLIAQAQKDILRITTNGNEWGTELLLTVGANEPVMVRGLATSHNQTFGEYGAPVSGKNIHVSIAEGALIAAGLNPRNANGEVAMTSWKVQWEDSTGLVKPYKIASTQPDNTIGLIRCFLNEMDNG